MLLILNVLIVVLKVLVIVVAVSVYMVLFALWAIAMYIGTNPKNWMVQYPPYLTKHEEEGK